MLSNNSSKCERVKRIGLTADLHLGLIAAHNAEFHAKLPST